MMIAWILALGCGGGTVDPSFISDVQVVDVVVSSPEARPGESVTLTVHAADPQDRGVEILIWTCTDIGGGCLEPLLGGLSDWVDLLELRDGVAVARRRIPDATSDLEMLGVESVEARLQVLACGVGLCPLMDTARLALGPTPMEDVETELIDALSDPTGWMGSLPFDGVSLAGRGVAISQRADEERNHNPEFEARFSGADDATVSAEAGEPLTLSFHVSDIEGGGGRAWAYTTIGSFPDHKEAVNDNTIRLHLQPGSAGSGRLFVVFTDDDGGSAVWQRPVTVAPATSE